MEASGVPLDAIVIRSVDSRYVDYICPFFNLRSLSLFTLVHKHSIEPKPEHWTSRCLALVEQPCVSQLRMA